MQTKITASSFIERSNKLFNNTYDYSLVNFVDSKTKVKIICEKHGIFEREPSRHLNGRGCAICGREKRALKITNTKEQFIQKANLKHNFKYDYSLVEYVNNKGILKIICTIHGLFLQKVYDHLSGCGCIKCGIKSASKIKTISIEKFIENANKIHNNKYNYNKSVYIKANIKINIICLVHGEFEQTPANHLAGKGCNKCGRINTITYNSKNPGGWSISSWKNKAEKSKNFDSFKVYILECWDEEERFYKIGRTFCTIKRRFDSIKDLPYNWKVLKIFEGSAEEIYKLENILKQQNKQNKYIPKIYFPGLQECFSKLNLERALKKLIN